MVDKILGGSGHREEKDAGDKKMPYKKPVVMSIRLFADQVLYICRNTDVECEAYPRS